MVPSDLDSMAHDAPEHRSNVLPATNLEPDEEPSFTSTGRPRSTSTTGGYQPLRSSNTSSLGTTIEEGFFTATSTSTPTLTRYYSLHRASQSPQQYRTPPSPPPAAHLMPSTSPTAASFQPSSLSPTSSLRTHSTAPLKPTVTSPAYLTHDPAVILCPRCRIVTNTSTRKESGDAVATWSVILCCLTGTLCAWIPCIMTDCKDTVHYCPNCDLQIASVNRAGSTFVSQDIKRFEAQKAGGNASSPIRRQEMTYCPTSLTSSSTLRNGEITPTSPTLSEIGSSMTPSIVNSLSRSGSRHGFPGAHTHAHDRRRLVRRSELDASPIHEVFEMPANEVPDRSNDSERRGDEVTDRSGSENDAHAAENVEGRKLLTCQGRQGTGLAIPSRPA